MVVAIVVALIVGRIVAAVAVVLFAVAIVVVVVVDYTTRLVQPPETPQAPRVRRRLLGSCAMCHVNF